MLNRRNPTNGLLKRIRFRSSAAPSRTIILICSCEERNECEASVVAMCDAGIIFFGA